jgi:peptidoglycan biosynthesis protein MviN/MurJ (putative lipid II flippase)
VASLLNAVLLLIMLHRRLGGIGAGAIVNGLVRVTLAAVIMGIAAGVVHTWLLGIWPSGRLLPQIVRLGASIGVALVVLAASAHALRVPQFAEGVALIRRRLRR